LLPKRFGASQDYRYGFQGQEKDDELKGEGNSLNYTFRMHDPRVGRFFAVDPLTKKYPYLTPYQFSSNQPIHAKELEGLESSNPIGAEAGIKASFSLGGGFSASLYGGLSAKGNIGDVGGMASVNIAATSYSGGPGTSPLSPHLFTLTASPALTLGVGSGSSMNLNLFNSQSGSGVNNSFDSSLTYGKNYIFSSGTNSDGSGRNQITGAVAIKLGNLQIASYNDTSRAPFFGPKTDQFWSAGVNTQVKNGDLTLSYSFDCYYGLSNQSANYDRDRIIGGQNFDNQDVFDMLLNNGIEKMSLQHTTYGTMQSGSLTGSQSFWPSNAMHDSMAQPSFRKPNATFHHLFVPYDNGMTKPSFSKFNTYLKGTTFDNSFYDANKVNIDFKE
jgi:RHS repeat-associated protein